LQDRQIPLEFASALEHPAGVGQVMWVNALDKDAPHVDDNGVMLFADLGSDGHRPV